MFHLGWDTVERILQGQRPVASPDNMLRELAASESFIDRHTGITDRGPKAESAD